MDSESRIRWYASKWNNTVRSQTRSQNDTFEINSSVTLRTRIILKIVCNENF